MSTYSTNQRGKANRTEEGVASEALLAITLGVDLSFHKKKPLSLCVLKLASHAKRLAKSVRLTPLAAMSGTQASAGTCVTTSAMAFLPHLIALLSQGYIISEDKNWVSAKTEKPAHAV